MLESEINTRDRNILFFGPRASPVLGPTSMVSTSASAVWIGLAIFVVAGLQTMNYRELLGLTQQQFERAPVYIVVEVLVAATLCMWGSLGLAGTLKPINPFTQQRGLDAQSFRPDFMSFNHRGHLMPLDIAPLPGRRS